MAGVTRRRFIQTTAATGAAAALLPATKARAARTAPIATDLPLRTRSYLEQQRKAALAMGGNLAFLTGTQLAALLQARDVSSREAPRPS